MFKPSHSSNDNELPDGSKGSMFWAGRVWWWDSSQKDLARIEWKLGWKTRSFQIGVCLTQESDWVWSIALPFLFSFYFHWSTKKCPKREQRWEFTIHHWGLWLSLGRDEYSYSIDDPWWWHWHLDIPDFFLGQSKYASKDLKTVEANMYLPEGPLPVKVTLQFDSWKRSRWPWPQHMRRAKVEVIDPEGAPVPGKGTMPYNCGADAIYSSVMPVSTVEEAVAKMTESVLRDRNKYGSGDSYDPKV